MEAASGRWLYWAAQAAAAASYLLFRAAYDDPAAAVRQPSYLSEYVPGATQELDIVAVTLLLSAQRYRRCVRRWVGWLGRQVPPQLLMWRRGCCAGRPMIAPPLG
jgi:hypothetical protein